MQTGVIVKTRPADEVADIDHDEDQENGSEIDELEAVVEDGIRAYKNGDIRRLAQVVKMAHDLLHEHMENDKSDISKESKAEEARHSFHDMNVKAAKENR